MTILVEANFRNRRPFATVHADRSKEEKIGEGLSRPDLQELLKLSPTFSDFVELFTLPASGDSPSKTSRSKRS